MTAATVYLKANNDIVSVIQNVLLPIKQGHKDESGGVVERSLVHSHPAWKELGRDVGSASCSR